MRPRESSLALDLQALEIAAEDIVVVRRRGKPVATIQAITEDDLEDLLLERSDASWKLIDRARKGKSLSIEEVRKRLRHPAKRKRRPKR